MLSYINIRSDTQEVAVWTGLAWSGAQFNVKILMHTAGAVCTKSATITISRTSLLRVINEPESYFIPTNYKSPWAYNWKVFKVKGM
jgi:hypothetical protein